MMLNKTYYLQFHGRGTLTLPTKKVYVGEWLNGEKDGQGVLDYGNGERYEGQWKQNKVSVPCLDLSFTFFFHFFFLLLLLVHHLEMMCFCVCVCCITTEAWNWCQPDPRLMGRALQWALGDGQEGRPRHYDLHGQIQIRGHMESR